ncbi:hypothetical protein [Microcoleus sp. BROC3]|uniref:hypothetical protein n=1 Tax=Microcoleus sp. BROC3 TaxID=3055323 RepID=UPI002FD1F061
MFVKTLLLAPAFFLFPSASCLKTPISSKAAKVRCSQKLGDANQAASKPIAQGLVNRPCSGFEWYLSVNILSGQLPAITTTAACRRAMGDDIKIFESRDRMSALIYSAASFNPIQGRNSSVRPPCYLPPKQLH